MDVDSIYEGIDDNDDEELKDGIERRRAFRLDMEKELIDIKFVDENGKEQQKKIACLDFSRGGVRLDCDHDIPVNTHVTVIFKRAAPQSQVLTAKVLRCIKQSNGWFEIALILDDKA